MTDTRQLTYVGPAALASALAQMLREEGVTVDMEPPREQRGLSDVPQEVVVNLLTTGTAAALTAATKSAITRFHKRFPGAAKIDDDEPTPEDSDHDD